VWFQGNGVGITAISTVYFELCMSEAATWKMHRIVNDAIRTKHISKKGKAIPLQAWTDPEGSRRLRLPYFKTIGT